MLHLPNLEPNPNTRARKTHHKNKLRRDRRRAWWMTSGRCDLDGTSSVKDKQPKAQHHNRLPSHPYPDTIPTTIVPRLPSHPFVCSIANPSPELPTNLPVPTNALRS